MGRRNKSRFERWFSLGQQKRRASAKKLLDQILQAANLGRLTKIQYLIDGCGDDFLKFELTHRFETMIENFDIAGIISIVQEMQNSDEQNNDQ